jgi:hypothetical protein
MPQVGFEPMTLAVERAKRVHALHRVGAVISLYEFYTSWKWENKVRRV